MRLAAANSRLSNAVSLESVGLATHGYPKRQFACSATLTFGPGVGGGNAARLTLILCDLAHSSQVTRVGASMALVLTTSKRLRRHRIGCGRHHRFRAFVY